MITFIAQLEVAPENGAALEALLTRVRDQTLANEPGVACYAFGRDADDPCRYAVVEVYRDAAAHAAHMATAWVRDSIPEALRLTGGAMTIHQYVGPGTQPAVRRFSEAPR